MVWNPRRTLQETEALLTSPGTIHEISTTLVDGKLQRVYKNLWPSLRQFWLSAVSRYAEDTYVVFEQQKLTYNQVHGRSLKLASLLSKIYNIQKGDRVAICSRNSPEYLVAFWACHLIGAVSVLVNAWLPLDLLNHCLAHTECKIVVIDPERANLLQPVASQLLQKSTITTFLVTNSTLPEQSARSWRNLMSSMEEVMQDYCNDGLEILQSAISIEPEDNATILFTSGTTGVPKGVLSTQRQFLTNVLNILAGGFRAALRRGEDLPTVQRSSPQKAALVNVPLFHVTGSTSYSMMATLMGMKVVMMRKWDVEEAIKLIKEERISIAGGVPSMVTDLVTSTLINYPLECVLFGGAPAPESLVQRAREAFPHAALTQGYGLTETNSIAVSLAGEDQVSRPTSTGLASPVNEIRIVRDGTCLPPNNVGEVWLRGSNVMKCYWRDPDATKEAITQDGWLKSGDLGYLDDEGFLFIKDRIKDIIIRGGENIDSVSVENAFYADPRVLEVAAVGVPDGRLGEVVAAVVYLRPDCEDARKVVTEESLIERAKERLPQFAVPVMVVLTTTPLKRTPSGKIIKNELREFARKEWESRRRNAAKYDGKTRCGRLVRASL